MTPLECFAILAAIWLAPQTGKGLGLAIGSAYLALAVVAFAIEIFK